ncbi:MAG: hypothetical protein Q7T56_01655 [Nocardioidaceae bacterium]|nr:hypothetical protein [Nocardioidaceae bacterium]
MRLRRASSLLSLLLSTALVAVGSPASAATKTFVDAKGDAPFDVDIRKVKVVHGKKAVRIVVRVQDLVLDEFGLAPESSVFIDTKKSKRGPEYMVGTGGYHAYFFAVKNWKLLSFPDDPYGDITCGWKLAESESADLLTYQVPRSCLGNPSRIRVSVVIRSYDQDGNTVSSDKSPAYRKFHGWVRRG